jgi:membrane protein
LPRTLGSGDLASVPICANPGCAMADLDDTVKRAEGDLADVRHQLADDASAVQRSAATTLARHPTWARIVDVAHKVAAEQASEQVGLAASGAAFWVVISSFPTAIAAISVFGLVVSPQQVAGELGGLARTGPSSLGSTVTDQLSRVAATDHTGLSVGLAVSVIVALWSASAGVYNVDRAVRAAYGLPRQSYVDARWRAFLGSIVVVLVVGLIGLVAAGVSSVSGHVPPAVVAAISLPTLLVAMIVMAAALYRFSVGERAGVRAVLPGALTSAFGVVLVAAALTGYVHVSSHYTAVYGALAGAVIAMIGTYLAVFVVLIGAVLNVQLAAKNDVAQEREDL